VRATSLTRYDRRTAKLQIKMVRKRALIAAGSAASSASVNELGWDPAGRQTQQY
jgi:hypothetical protein